MKTRLCHLKGEDQKEPQGFPWPKYLQEAALAGVLVGEWNRLGFLPLTPQPGALVQDMACPNPKAAPGSFGNRFFGNWLALDEDHKKYSVPCCERSRIPLTTHASPLILLNPLELMVPLPSTYTSFRDFHISSPPSLAPSSLQKHEHCAPRSKPPPNNAKGMLWVVFRGERCGHLESRGTLDPCSCATVFTEVLSHFALSLKQDRLLKP